MVRCAIGSARLPVADAEGRIRSVVCRKSGGGARTIVARHLGLPCHTNWLGADARARRRAKSGIAWTSAA